MPRPPRLHVPGGFYHVILRGNHREDIFFSPHDRDRFGELLEKAITRFSMRAHGYCWMTNHVHLILQAGDVPLGQAMMCVAGAYARETQRNRRSTTGHLFERRYRAILIDEDSYLLQLLRYIHLNPVRARMVKDPAAYAWSSHRAYLGMSVVPWLTTDFALRIFGRDMSAARRAYSRFVLDGIGVEPDPDLSHGSSEDMRVLGDESFLARLPVSSFRATARARSCVDALIGRIAAENGVSEALLSSPSRCRRLAKIRALIVREALEMKCATLSDLGRRFRRSVSALRQCIR